jgi:deazaflavin-dependent oxidoreductase (nitroreductase family)
MNPLALRFGSPWLLVVPGRHSGTPRRTPVNLLELSGESYLVAPRGETGWVRNVRAAGVVELRRGGDQRVARAIEVPVEQRRPVIEAYRARWDRAVRRQFEALPDDAQHPVFRLAPLDDEAWTAWRRAHGRAI